ncbi:uncharacterized protein LOC115033276 [Acyrthosiphon pisum]|uniref:Uncharacterized protein n=1 Tax=Acyrthosiphon pisum TaxID=7029 RepID=A0A8R2JL93_ACYPI|nr:uncharacterized protein LOC115033276 [Acyrthosiphon pisum]
MDHYIFECRYKFPSFSEEETLLGWHVLLYDELWAGHPEFRCALYETVREDPPMFKMVISGTHSCEGLLKRMKQSEQAVPEEFRHIADGSIALMFSRDFPLSPNWRKKRSEEQRPRVQFTS